MPIKEARPIAHNPFADGYYESEALRRFGFASVGDNVRIAKSCNIPRVDTIEIGDNVRIDAFTAIIAASGHLKLGSYIHIGGHCHLGCRGGIEMEDFSGLSQGVHIYSASDDYSGRHMTNPTVPEGYAGAHVAPVRIGRHAIIGSGSVIMPGVTLSEGAAVGALSFVIASVPEWTVHAGTPATKRADRHRQALALEREMMTASNSKQPAPAAADGAGDA